MVSLNGATLLKTDGPALVTGYRRAENSLSLHVASEAALTLTLGGLPPATAITVNGAPHTTSASGQITLRVHPPQELGLRW
jgi:hypothetical protein